MLGHVEKIDVLDRHTVKFTLTEPFGWFLDYLANTVMWIVPREAVDQYGDLRRAEACIGTGPWMLERYEPNTRLTFVRHKDYFVPACHTRTASRWWSTRIPPRAWPAGSPGATTSRRSTVNACDASISRWRGSASRDCEPRTSSSSSAPLPR